MTALEGSSPKMLSLVTGANGHLSNNIVRELCTQGQFVRAGVLNVNRTAPFEGLNTCELVRLDIQDEQLMQQAMAGVDIVYASAAFPVSMSNKDSYRDIYDVKMNATRVLMRAAWKAGVRRVVFVSSIMALDFTTLPANESSGYSNQRWNAYSSSTNDSDKLALQLGRDLGVEIVVVLPGTLIGGDCYDITSAYQYFWNIYTNKLTLDPNVFMNWCDVKDIARGCLQAGERGISGQRYLLAHETSTNIRDTVHILQDIYPKRQFRVPTRPSKLRLWMSVWILEKLAAFLAVPPLMRTASVDGSWGLRLTCDTTRARTELGYTPKSVADTIRDAVEYLEAHPHLVA